MLAAGWCSTPTQLLICSSFSRENCHLLLICSSLSAAQAERCSLDQEALLTFGSDPRWLVAAFWLGKGVRSLESSIFTVFLWRFGNPVETTGDG